MLLALQLRFHGQRRRQKLCLRSCHRSLGFRVQVLRLGRPHHLLRLQGHVRLHHLLQLHLLPFSCPSERPQLS